MAFDTYEKSIQDGEPIELYEFVRGAVHWYYTSSATDKTVGIHTYTAAQLQRTAIEHTSDKGRNSLKVECPRDFTIADLYRISPPSDVITLTVTRIHSGDTEAVVIWAGRLLNVEWSGAKATILCEPVSSSLARPGLRRLYSRQCPHVLYSNACGVSKAAFKVTATLSAVNGATLDSPTFGAYGVSYFAGGFLEFDNSDGTKERRFITGHGSTLITLNMPLPALEAGSQVDVYPGCDHNLATCSSKYSNGLNYGGFPYIPTKNPFGGGSLY